MSRSVVAALIFFSLLVPSWAQHGGGGHGGGGGFGGHGGGGFGGGFASHGFSGGGFSGGFHGGARGPGYAPNGGNYYAHGYNHYGYRSYSRYYRGAGYYPYGYGYGYGYGLPLYGYGDYGFAPDYDPSAYYADPGDPQVYAQEQQQDIDRLEQEVAQLRAERNGQDPPEQATSQPRVPRPQVKSATSETAILVYRDKHSEEIDNYAIMGKTVWIFSDDRSKRVSIAALDVPATVKANEDRGVDFRLPQ